MLIPPADQHHRPAGTDHRRSANGPGVSHPTDPATLAAPLAAPAPLAPLSRLDHAGRARTAAWLQRSVGNGPLAGSAPVTTRPAPGSAEPASAPAPAPAHQGAAMAGSPSAHLTSPDPAALAAATQLGPLAAFYGMDSASWIQLDLQAQQWAAGRAVAADPEEAAYWRALLTLFPAVLVEHWPELLVGAAVIFVGLQGGLLSGLLVTALVVLAGFAQAFENRVHEYVTDTGHWPTVGQAARPAAIDVLSAGGSKIVEGYQRERPSGARMTPEEGARQTTDGLITAGLSVLTVFAGRGLARLRAQPPRRGPAIRPDGLELSSTPANDVLPGPTEPLAEVIPIRPAAVPEVAPAKRAMGAKDICLLDPEPADSRPHAMASRRKGGSKGGSDRPGQSEPGRGEPGRGERVDGPDRTGADGGSGHSTEPPQARGMGDPAPRSNPAGSWPEEIERSWAEFLTRWTRIRHGQLAEVEMVRTDQGYALRDGERLHPVSDQLAELVRNLYFKRPPFSLRDAVEASGYSAGADSQLAALQTRVVQAVLDHLVSAGVLDRVPTRGAGGQGTGGQSALPGADASSVEVGYQVRPLASRTGRAPAEGRSTQGSSTSAPGLPSTSRPAGRFDLTASSYLANDALNIVVSVLHPDSPVSSMSRTPVPVEVILRYEPNGRLHIDDVAAEQPSSPYPDVDLKAVTRHPTDPWPIQEIFELAWTQVESFAAQVGLADASLAPKDCRITFGPEQVASLLRVATSTNRPVSELVPFTDEFIALDNLADQFGLRAEVAPGQLQELAAAGPTTLEVAIDMLPHSKPTAPVRHPTPMVLDPPPPLDPSMAAVLRSIDLGARLVDGVWHVQTNPRQAPSPEGSTTVLEFFEILTRLLRGRLAEQRLGADFTAWLVSNLQVIPGAGIEPMLTFLRETGQIRVVGRTRDGYLIYRFTDQN